MGSDARLPFDTSLPWVPYVTRPYDLFGASLWHYTYVCPQIKRVIGVMPHMLGVEHPRDTTRAYRLQSELGPFVDIVRSRVKTDKAACIKLFKKGDELNEKARVYASGQKSFITFEEALDFQMELLVHSTLFPYFALMCIKEIGITDADAEFVRRAEALRAISMFSPLHEKYIMPLGQEKLRSLGATAENTIRGATIYEVLRGDISKVEKRLQNISAGKYFVYQNLAGEESVVYVDETDSVIRMLEGDVPQESSFKGQVAFKGKARGHVRQVHSWFGEGAEFNPGDILVSTSTSPNLIHFMKICGAIVTDEGGIMSHAAIVSRELKKPCVIGTKIATRVLKDGDMVEVDAERGVVTILQRA